MEIKPIKTDRDYRRALKAIDRLIDAKHNTPHGNALNVLATLVEQWEQEHYPIDSPSR